MLLVLYMEQSHLVFLMVLLAKNNKLMKKKNILLSLMLILVFFVLLKFALDFFSVPTPMKYAKRQSGLDLPEGIKVARFEEHWENANGDGSRYIEFDLTQEEVEDLERQCLKKSYSKLPVKENGYDPFTSKKIDKGYYKITFTSSHDRSHELTILDVTRKKLYLIVEVV